MENFTQLFEAIKSIDYKDLLARAAWTFLQGFLAVFAFAYEQILDLLFTGDWSGLYALLLALSVGGIAAGLSALKTFVLETIRSYKK